MDLGGDWYEERVVATARRKEHERRQRIKGLWDGSVETGRKIKRRGRGKKGDGKKETEAKVARGTALRRCKKRKRKWKKAAKLKAGKRGREPQRPQSHPVTAPTPWPVSKSTLQAFSILAPYFSVLLIYRFIVHQPV